MAKFNPDAPALQGQSTSTTIDYVYNPLYRLTEASYSTGDYYRYTYDSVGNRLTQQSYLSNDTYIYDNANRLTTVNGITHTWDANGNLLNDGTNTYTYDAANRLTSLTGTSGTSTFSYNGLGDRLTQNGVQYTLDLNAGLTQVLADGTNTYLYGLARLAERGGGTNEYHLGDALGSVRQLTNTSGEVTLTRRYDPYGKASQSGGSSQTEYGFTGEAADASGLIYLRARYYAPTDGRFLSRDTWEGDVNHPLSMNRWLYVEGNPVNYRDPFGLWSIAPGFDLSNGGLYGQGQLTVPTSILCTTTCYTERGSTESVPIFVPRKRNGILYNDIILQLPRCDAWELAIPTNTNDWEVIFTKSGKSQAFSQGLFTTLAVGVGTGGGYESGMVPVGIEVIPSYGFDVSSTVAYQLFRAQNSMERERLNLVELWNKSNADLYEARVGGVIFLVQGFQGAQAFNSRGYVIIVQEHKRVKRFYRAIIETTAAYQNVRSGKIIITSMFASFENGRWKEYGFNWASSP